MTSEERLKHPTPYQRADRKQGFITYAAHLRAYAIYSIHHGTQQTADRLWQRGGFGESELDEYYPEWRNHIVEKVS